MKYTISFQFEENGFVNWYHYNDGASHWWTTDKDNARKMGAKEMMEVYRMLSNIEGGIIIVHQVFDNNNPYEDYDRAMRGI